MSNNLISVLSDSDFDSTPYFIAENQGVSLVVDNPQPALRWNPELMSSRYPTLFTDNTLFVSFFSHSASHAFQLLSDNVKVFGVKAKSLSIHKELTKLNELAAKIYLRNSNMTDSPVASLAQSFRVDPNDIVRHPAFLADYVTSPAFDPTQYSGPVDDFLTPKGGTHKIAVIRLAGQVVLPRYPSPNGYHNITGSFLGLLMASRKCPSISSLEEVAPGALTAGTIYAIANAEDAACVAGEQLWKFGMTCNTTPRRSVHQTNNPESSRLMWSVESEKYTARSLETMVKSTLLPWLYHGTETFNLPYIVRYMFSQIQTEAQLIKLCAALSTPLGREKVVLLENSLVHGRITHVDTHRVIEVAAPPAVEQEVSVTI